MQHPFIHIFTVLLFCLTLPVMAKAAVEEKNIKARVDTKTTAKELLVEYSGTLTKDHVSLYTCASHACEIIATKNKGDMLDIVAKTTDGVWYKTSTPNGYVLREHVRVEFKADHELKPQNAQTLPEDTIKNRSKIEEVSINVPQEQKSDREAQKMPLLFENNRSESSDALLAHSGELALKYQQEAHIHNLTKTATPMPVKISARYARALDFPLLNKSGDVYTDYTYVWIKIKEEAFVLGKREGKVPEGQYTIHKRIQ